MIDLAKFLLTDSIIVDSKEYKIKTLFKYWLNFEDMVKENHTLNDFDFFYSDLENIPDREKGFNELVKFYNPKTPLPRSAGQENSIQVLSFKQDADLIYSAFFEQYGINLVSSNLHWHEFLALLRGLHGTKLNEVMGFRSYEENTTDYKTAMKELKEAWRLEPELTIEEKRDLEKFNETFS